MKTYVKEPLKKDGIYYKVGEEVSFDSETTEDFLSRGLIQTESLDEDDETEPEEETVKVPTEAEVKKMNGTQLKKLIEDYHFVVDTTATVAKQKEAVIAILATAEKKDDETEPEEENL